MRDDPKPTVYYDGSCPLCSVEIRHYRSREGGDRLDYVDVSGGTDPGGGLSCDAAMKRFHVRMPNGELRSGAAGFVSIWEVLPGWRWAARMARVPGVLPVLEVAYRGFLPLRPWLSRVARRLGAEPINQG